MRQGRGIAHSKSRPELTAPRLSIAWASGCVTDAINLMESGFIEFNQDSSGQFGSIAVLGWMDCQAATRDGRPCVEFTWEGSEVTRSAAAVSRRSAMRARSTVASSSTSATIPPLPGVP